MSPANDFDGRKHSVRRFIARHSDAPYIEAARSLVYRVEALLHAENHDPLTNGESGLLTVLRDATCVVDVGAHRGSWTRIALAACPRAEIHCFEISGSAREFLSRTLARESRVHVAGYGLLDRDGTIPVKEYTIDTELTSVVDYPHPSPFAWRAEPIRRGDAWMSDTGITSIDLLKVDVEGAELGVLRGFEGAIARGAVRAVQFEYGYAAILSNALLHDLSGFLSARGYVVGRLTSRRVRFRPYQLLDERFHGPNYVAVRRSDSRLVDSLERGWGIKSPA